MLVLSVNIDQDLRKLLQLLGCYRLTAHFAYTSSLHDPALQDDLTVFHRKFQFLYRLQLPRLIYRKDQFHQRILRACANHLFIRLSAQRQTDGPNNNGLTGSRFTGKDIEPVAKGNFRFINQCQILNM